MNSRRKRKEGPPMAEELIVSSGKTVSKSTGQKGSRSNSEFTEKRKDSILCPDYDDNTEDLIISERHKGKWSCSIMDDRARLYLITIFTLLFGIASLAFGLWLLLSPPPKKGKFQSGLTAVIIGVLLFAPGSYGVTRIIQMISQSRKNRQSKSIKDDQNSYHVITKV